MNPGATISPRASNFSSTDPRILFGSATSATRPSRSSTSIGALILAPGSTTCPPLISKLALSARIIELTPQDSTCHPERALSAKDLCRSVCHRASAQMLRFAQDDKAADDDE